MSYLLGAYHQINPIHGRHLVGDGGGGGGGACPSHFWQCVCVCGGGFRIYDVPTHTHTRFGIEKNPFFLNSMTYYERHTFHRENLRKKQDFTFFYRCYKNTDILNKRITLSYVAVFVLFCFCQ